MTKIVSRIDKWVESLDNEGKVDVYSSEDVAEMGDDLERRIDKFDQTYAEKELRSLEESAATVLTF